MLRLSALALSLALITAPAFANDGYLSAPADADSANDTPIYAASDSTDSFRGDPNAPAELTGKAAMGAARPIVVTEVVKPAEKETKLVTQTTVVNPNKPATWANAPQTVNTKVIVPAGSKVVVPADDAGTTTIQVQ